MLYQGFQHDAAVVIMFCCTIDDIVHLCRPAAAKKLVDEGITTLEGSCVMLCECQYSNAMSTF